MTDYGLICATCISPFSTTYHLSPITYLTPTTSGYGISASQIPAKWSFIMMARPRIRAAR